MSREALTVLAAIGSGVTGGVYFAFSDFVMRALRRLPPRQGMAAMQQINGAAPSPLFMTALFGTAAICIALAVLATADRAEPGAKHQIAGSGLYLTTVILTAAYHVPRNSALAGTDPQAAAAVRVWASYASRWTLWNHARSIGAIAAAATFAVGLTRS